MADATNPKNSGISGKIVVGALLALGLIGGGVLSHYMPRNNPKATEPGSPYYSPPNEDELKAAKARAEQGK